jgi:hypothetical protein
MAFLDVDASQFSGAGKRLQGIEAVLSKQIEESTKTIEPEWKRLLARSASTKLEKRTIGSTGTATVIENGIRLEAGKSGSLAFLSGPAEYGATREKKSTYKRRSRKGGSHAVTRHTTRQFRTYKKTGYVFAPAVKAIVPKLAKAWTEALGVSINDTIEG